ncbi:MAG: substrate-binding domain-containing protein [Dysosmobacter welbionis]
MFLSENLRDQPQSYVSVDNSRGAYLGVEYLYGLGHREILYFGCRNSTTHQLRAEGYLRACRQFGLEPRLHHSDFARSSIENGYQMVKTVCKAHRLYSDLCLYGLQRTGHPEGG